MSITFRQAEGARVGGTGTRTINIITAGVLTPDTGTISGTAGPAVPGDILEIFGSTTDNNDGFYTITTVNDLAIDTYLVRPTPNNGTLGSVARLTRATAYALGATTCNSVTALPGSGSLGVITVSGANFETLDVRHNDRVTLSGNSQAANNGGWYVQEILSQDMLCVRPPDNGAGMVTVGSSSGSISVRAGRHVPTITNEAALTMDFIRSNATASGSGSRIFGSGRMRDYIRKLGVGGFSGDMEDVRTLFVIENMGGAWTFNNAGIASSTFTSANEIIIDGNSRTAGTGGNLGSMIWSTTGGTWPTPMLFTFGKPGLDRYAVNSGTITVGIRIGLTPNMKTNGYGSYLDAVAGTTPGLTAGAGNVAGCIVRGDVGLNTTGGLVESCVLYGVQPLVANGAGDQQNLLVSEATLACVISVDATVGGVLISQESILPTFLYTDLGTGTLVFLDPREDYDLLTIASASFDVLTIEKQYTYNPRFVANDSSGASVTTISGLGVEIFELDETALTETSIFSGLTDVNGQINSGAGLVVRRQMATKLFTAPESTNYAHRLLLQGAGFRRVNVLTQITQKLITTDIPVDRISPDYEGEFDE